MLKRTFLFLTLAFTLTLATTSIAAEPAYVAVVDVQTLLSESKAAQDIKKQVESLQKKFLDELKKKEEDLRAQEKTLIDQSNDLSKEEFAKKRKDFEEKLIETRRSAQSRKQELDKAASKALNKLRGEIFKVVEKITDEEGYNLVISKSNVVLGANSINITDKTLKQLDTNIQKIALDATSN